MASAKEESNTRVYWRSGKGPSGTGQLVKSVDSLAVSFMVSNPQDDPNAGPPRPITHASVARNVMPVGPEFTVGEVEGTLLKTLVEHGGDGKEVSARVCFRNMLAKV